MYSEDIIIRRVNNGYVVLPKLEHNEAITTKSLYVFYDAKELKDHIEQHFQPYDLKD